MSTQDTSHNATNPDPTPRTHPTVKQFLYRATARALRERLENHVAEATETGVWDLAGWTATLDDLIALAAAEARPNATAATARDALVAKVTGDWDADPHGEYEAARSRLIADLDNLIALAAAEARPNATAATARERVKAMQRALLMSPRVRDGVWLRDSGHQYRAAEEVLAEFDQALAIPASPAGVAALTPGDFAKALHDAHRVLGYWPDPAIIDGRWEMWGVVLHSLLAAAEAPGRVAALEAALVEVSEFITPDGPCWCTTYPGRDGEHSGWCVIAQAALAALAPTPSEPVERCVTCGRPLLSNAHEWDHPFTPATRDE